MRKVRQNIDQSEESKSLRSLSESLSEIKSRLEKLERQVFEQRLVTHNPSQGKQLRGRKQILETQKLLRRRGSLTAWMEQNWPLLSIALRKSERSSDPSIAITAMIACQTEGVPGVFQPPFYHSPRDYKKPLGDFLKSGRFHGNPKNVAAAMAGLPELSWKRSFDICSKHPSKNGIELPALRDYVKRKFPDRFKELKAAQTTQEVSVVLDRSRTHDPIYLSLRDHPDRVKEWLEEGKPNR